MYHYVYYLVLSISYLCVLQRILLQLPLLVLEPLNEFDRVVRRVTLPVGRHQEHGQLGVRHVARLEVLQVDGLLSISVSV